jgi:hypothetical protein
MDGGGVEVLIELLGHIHLPIVKLPEEGFHPPSAPEAISFPLRCHHFSNHTHSATAEFSHPTRSSAPRRDSCL